jgi:C-terminal peptidase prc
MRSQREKIFLFVILAGLCLFLFLEKKILPELSLSASPQKSPELVMKVADLIRNDYIEEPDPRRTMNGALKGMVDSLDVLSCYLDKESVLRYAQSQDPGSKDIGVILYKSFGFFPQVIGVVENSPAAKKGINIGDTISAVDDRSTLMMSMVETYLYIRDKNVKPVKLKIIRDSATQEVSVERATLYEPLFSYTKAKGTSGILKIHNLLPSCVKKIKQDVIPFLRRQEMTLVLDLRNCHQGDMEEARKLINIFLKAERIGYFEKKGEAKEFLSCPDQAELDKLPLVIWTNEATLGAAEAVAAVLKESRKAKVIGSATLGLVAKQDFFPLGDGSGILLTSSIFHLSTGKALWESGGVVPDVKLGPEERDDNSYLRKSFSLLP